MRLTCRERYHRKSFNANSLRNPHGIRRACAVAAPSMHRADKGSSLFSVEWVK
jgi:hypothetical protein